MEILLLIGATFLLCWLVDKGFHKLFRSKPQHVSGKAVRLSKYYALGGLILSVLGFLRHLLFSDNRLVLHKP